MQTLGEAEQGWQVCVDAESQTGVLPLHGVDEQERHAVPTQTASEVQPQLLPVVEPVLDPLEPVLELLLEAWPVVEELLLEEWPVVEEALLEACPVVEELLEEWPVVEEVLEASPVVDVLPAFPVEPVPLALAPCEPDDPESLPAAAPALVEEPLVVPPQPEATPATAQRTKSRFFMGCSSRHDGDRGRDIGVQNIVPNPSGRTQRHLGLQMRLRGGVCGQVRRQLEPPWPARSSAQ